MIYFFIGTKAQFIKMAPLMIELNKCRLEYRYIDSGQHAELTSKLRKTFNIGLPDIFLSHSRDITTVFEAIIWAYKILWRCMFGKNWIKKKVFISDGICLIHGDTLSTLLGLMMAKAAGIRVAHVEAGLRSNNIFHPFPEEIIRIYCMKRCDILFAPSVQARNNLKRMHIKGQIIDIPGNTVVDSLRLMQDVRFTVDIPAQPYVLATTHRIETITSRQRLSKIVNLLNKTAESIKVVFVTHKPTNKYLKKFGLLKKLSTNIKLLGMQDYMNFTALLKSAQMVFADGGSIQEECGYLNKPCLILRYKTERADGLGKNAVLWRFDQGIFESFIEKNHSHQPCMMEQYPSPSGQIADWLIKNQK